LHAVFSRGFVPFKNGDRLCVGGAVEDSNVAIAGVGDVHEWVGVVLKTGGHPESFQLEAKGTHLFVNVSNADNVVESFERTTGSVSKGRCGPQRKLCDVIEIKAITGSTPLREKSP
jgi:hypothetical protein